MEGLAYFIVVDMPVCILVIDKWEVLVDKDLVVVETYLLMKPGGWDFVIKKKWKILFVKYGV